MISVIVPVYNAETTIERCIESVIEQTIGKLEWELILIDDGSRDTSYQKCQRYAQTNMQIHVFKQSNRGAAAARNYGIEHANGQYLCFLDADDYFEPTALEKMQGAMRKNVEYIYGGYIRRTTICQSVINTSECIPSKASGIIADLPEPFFVNGWIHSAWGKAYKADIIKANGIRFPEDMKLSEDSMFNILYLGHVCTWQSISSTVYNYCNVLNSSSVTNRIYPQAFEWYIKLYDSLMELLLHIYTSSEAERICVNTIYPQYWAMIRKLSANHSPAAIDSLKKASNNVEICRVLRNAQKSTFESLIVELFILKRWRSISWAFYCYEYYAQHYKR